MPKRKYRLENYAWRRMCGLHANAGGFHDIYRYEVFAPTLVRKTRPALVTTRVLTYSGHAAEQMVFHRMEPAADWLDAVPFWAFRAFLLERSR